jgi:hypothetical protein
MTKKEKLETFDAVRSALYLAEHALRLVARGTKPDAHTRTVFEDGWRIDLKAWTTPRGRTLLRVARCLTNEQLPTVDAFDFDTYHNSLIEANHRGGSACMRETVALGEMARELHDVEAR